MTKQNSADYRVNSHLKAGKSKRWLPTLREKISRKRTVSVRSTDAND